MINELLTWHDPFYTGSLTTMAGDENAVGRVYKITTAYSHIAYEPGGYE